MKYYHTFYHFSYIGGEGGNIPSKIKKKRDLLCNYLKVVEKTDARITPSYGLSFYSFCYSSVAVAQTPEPTTAATNP